MKTDKRKDHLQSLYEWVFICYEGKKTLIAMHNVSILCLSAFKNVSIMMILYLDGD